MGSGKLIRTITRGGLAVYVACFGIKYNNPTIVLANEIPKEQTLEEKVSPEDIDFIVSHISEYLTYEGRDPEILNRLKNGVKNEISLEGKLRVINSSFNLGRLREYKTKDLFVYAPLNNILIDDTRPEDKKVVIQAGMYKPGGKEVSIDKFRDIYELVKNKNYEIIFLKFENNLAILVFDQDNLRVVGFSDDSFSLESK